MDETDFEKNSICKRPFLGLIDEYADASGTQEYARMETEFTAIGSGNYTALSTLYRRAQESTDSLSRTLYNVWEANRLSEQVPGVGRNYIAIYVLHQSGRMEELSKSGFEHLRKSFKKFGPKDISQKQEVELEVKGEFFDLLCG